MQSYHISLTLTAQCVYEHWRQKKYVSIIFGQWLLLINRKYVHGLTPYFFLCHIMHFFLNLINKNQFFTYLIYIYFLIQSLVITFTCIRPIYFYQHKWQISKLQNQVWSINSDSPSFLTYWSVHVSYENYEILERHGKLDWNQILTLSVYPWGLFLKSWSMPPPILNPHFNSSRPSVSIADSLVKVIGIYNNLYKQSKDVKHWISL